MGTGTKGVRLIVNKDWTPETISTLGSGFFYHLSYPVEEIEPELLADIRNALLPPGTEMEILFHKNGELRRVALAELGSIIDFNTFIRLEFRLMHTLPSLKEVRSSAPNGYLLYYYHK
ncbi:MAG TPA: hypothetical protein GXX33_03665 [Firmicutes bacterium]|uniref:Uncharacterized protein n=1 Tax=Capillibacterium thermochitinicola TaxID=2699427 RepID=A0A8J6LM28_9FIRM|nr:hypothetical protein [Capillibacterium thermochitinicola]MBA2133189.1 hypothetical protein [Capillibacterium thermochitinicola]HHW12081.1 hypothetical protein [Bacillota bacterium]